MSEEQKQYEVNDEVENLKIGYELLQNDLSSQVERLKTADEKLNMLLVFNAAILALLTIVFPINLLSYARFILAIIFLTLFMTSMVLTLVMIIIAIFPRSIPRIADTNYVDGTFYHCSSTNFLGKIMGECQRTIEKTHKIAEKKYCFTKASMILTIINIWLMIALIFIKII